MRSERPAKRVLFVFAHQDDECFVSTRIARELEWGHEVHCLYLTDGEARGVPSAVRDAESARVLASLGLPRERLHFLGSRYRIPDGALVDHLEESFERICEAFDPLALGRIYCLAFEGGHHDHDASHLLAVAYARRRGLVQRTWQIALYNGFGMPGRLFRVDHPLELPLRRCDRRLALGAALRHVSLCFRYPTQWKSFFVAFPEHFLTRVLLRRESIQAVSPALLDTRPHAGPLLYEDLYGLSWARFEAASRAFRRAQLSPSGAGGSQGTQAGE